MRRSRRRYSTDPEGLRACVVECFAPVQLHWANRNSEALRDYVSEPMRAHLEEQFEELDRNYAANRIEDLALLDARVPSRPDPEAESFTAELSFSAREWTEDLRTGARVDGEDDRPRRTTYEQRWRFVRADDHGWVVDDVITTNASSAED